MPADNRTAIVVACLSLIGVIATATFANWDKLTGPNVKAPAPLIVPLVPQAINGNNNVQISGSNNIVNPAPAPKACRDKSHGIEAYSRSFDTDRYSAWMGGGYSQDPWCNDVINELRGQNPEGRFTVLAKSESSKSRCKPFNCPEYRYYCKVRVETDPIYVEKISSACK